MRDFKHIASYKPQPINIADVCLPPELEVLVESLAENVHDTWACSRFDAGWQWGPERNDVRRTHPCLIPYGELSDAEKSYDRNTAVATLKAILKLGFSIAKSER